MLKNEQIQSLNHIGKWLVISIIIALFVGVAGALFITGLQFATDYRNANLWIIWLLPLGGLFVGLLYHYLGKTSEGGNNLIIDQINKPTRTIPWAMGPLVVFGTIITHLFGGSAGREGTAVQLGASIADQFTHLFQLKKRDKKIILISGVSAGFAAVFGTPLAAAIFALEVFRIGRTRYEAIFPAFLTGIMSYIVTSYCLKYVGLEHSHYHIPNIPEHIAFIHVGICIVAGIVFGLAALAFNKGTKWVSDFYKKIISYPPLRPVVGGLLVAMLIIFSDGYKFAGLGIPTIQSAFDIQMPAYDFMVKLVLTCLTLGAGYKGGEVTPLFFIGATLGNALAYILPPEIIPMGLLAGMGFVAVFAGAANTPIACIVMGAELFGMEPGLYIAIAVIVAYLVSGHSGIYKSQEIGISKIPQLLLHQNKKLGELKD